MATYLQRDWKYCYEVLGALLIHQTRPSEIFSLTLFHQRYNRTHDFHILCLKLSQQRYRSNTRPSYTHIQIEHTTFKDIQSHALPSYIQSNTRPSYHIFSLTLSEQRYRGNNIGVTDENTNSKLPL